VQGKKGGWLARGLLCRRIAVRVSARQLKLRGHNAHRMKCYSPCLLFHINVLGIRAELITNFVKCWHCRVRHLQAPHLPISTNTRTAMLLEHFRSYFILSDWDLQQSDYCISCFHVHSRFSSLHRCTNVLHPIAPPSCLRRYQSQLKRWKDSMGSLQINRGQQHCHCSMR